MKTLAFWTVATVLSVSGIARAADVKPYKSTEIKPYQSREVKPYAASPARARSAQQVRPVASGGEIKMYQSKEAKRYTKEDFARMNAQTAAEAKRIAANQKRATDPAAAANQVYWQEQIRRRQVEAANPDVTYRGR